MVSVLFAPGKGEEEKKSDPGVGFNSRAARRGGVIWKAKLTILHVVFLREQELHAPDALSGLLVAVKRPF